MELPPRIGAVLCVLQLLLPLRCGAEIRDCSDLPPGSDSGPNYISPDGETSISAFCDLANGEEWTVFQRRDERVSREDFHRDWDKYEEGFGNFLGEFWWGLHNLWLLTSKADRDYELRIDLWDSQGQTKYAIYQNFVVGSKEEGYRLDFAGYSGTAGDGLHDHKGMKFSTSDRDHDNWQNGNCAKFRLGGWWYNDCFGSNLNGYRSQGFPVGASHVIAWKTWKMSPLKAATMKIRPTRKM